MNLNLVIVVIFVTFILINCSSHLSFAKKNNEMNEDNNDFKQVHF